jgi:16S rRNA (adenine1518-N6/adenine1519-N6)-dimethyltransferase
MIKKKKHLGQHFLRRQSVADHMIEAANITPETSILEIGCGDGFLTQSILLATQCKQLVVYEIDPEWANFVKEKLQDKRLVIRIDDILSIDWHILEKDKPWIMLSNLPYQITFPILFKLQEHKDLFTEGVIMIQDEVAQKITATHGKKYSPTSLFLQYHFHLKLLEKIDPTAFSPPPKVNSRLVHFKPKTDPTPIPHKKSFWKFLKLCFRFPRQTLKNNLKSTHYPYKILTEELLAKRAQQLTFDQFLELWELIKTK